MFKSLEILLRGMNFKNDDYELVQDFLSGDQQAFNNLARKYQEKIYWHARRILGDHDDAHDVVQQVLLVMYNKLNTFNYSSSLYTWIFKITYTRSLNQLKKRKLKRIITLNFSDDIENPGYENIVDNLENKEELIRMQKMLNKLPLKQREVFILRNFDELSYDEISSITGKSVGALKANYFHAFKKIKELMGKDEN
ncbi:MAG: RNA polymerase sigma factor [Ignavibacteriaceae bacterium]|nr:RNA polymerase sigma factor [Ignavibacteriaceae bacterium]MCW8961105.1 RNA polymerase sigma factor [Ignavibacteriaceae bacterium]MCW9094653.1 RNA polymerase sigma factor [Ignavibacteriaceae bacterium]